MSEEGRAVSKMNLEVLKKIHRALDKEGILENPENAFALVESQDMYYFKSDFLMHLLSIPSKELYGEEEFGFKVKTSETKEETLNSNVERLRDMIKLMRVFTDED